MNQKILSVFLLLIWGFLSMFSYVIYELGRNECHLQFQNKMAQGEKMNIHNFSFSKKSQLSQEIKGSELKIKGKFYDIIEVVETDTFIIIKCVADLKEDGILSNYLRILNHNSTNNEHEESFNFKLDKYLERENLNEFIETFSIFQYGHSSFFPILSWFTEVLHPPPENGFL